MGPNNLTIVKKSCFSKKTVIYNKGELLRIDYTSKYNNKFGKYIVKLDAILSNGNSVFISRVFKLDSTREFDYFCHIINKHIQTEMKV